MDPRSLECEVGGAPRFGTSRPRSGLLHDTSSTLHTRSPITLPSPISSASSLTPPSLCLEFTIVDCAKPRSAHAARCSSTGISARRSGAQQRPVRSKRRRKAGEVQAQVRTSTQQQVTHSRILYYTLHIRACHGDNRSTTSRPQAKDLPR